MNKSELSFLHMTLLPNALYNLTKFHENSSKGVGFMSHTRFCLQMGGWTDRRTDGQTDGWMDRWMPGQLLYPWIDKNISKGLRVIACTI